MSQRLATVIALALASSVALAQAPQQPDASAQAPAFDEAEARAVVAKLASELEDNFVFPEAGNAYAAALRSKLAAGGYTKFPDGLAFAEAVTRDLQAVHPDGHLRLHPPRPGGAGGSSPLTRGDRPDPIGKSGWIAPGIAYIAFNLFPSDEATVARLKQFLEAHSGARTLIIDARTHGGGRLGEMDVMFPYFFDKPQTLVHMDTRVAVEQRRGNPLEGQSTVTKVKGPEGVIRRAHGVIPAAAATGLRTAKIYLLTSERTASAAEHLALSLKRTGRATLIGETTAGAGHYGGMVPLGGGYAAFIPVGRTFDPDTDKGWEGTGVKPDVEVPAERALAEALVRSGLAPAEAQRLSAEYHPALPMKRLRPRTS